MNKPTLGTAAATDAADYATAAQGATADTAVQPGDLSVVATSGDYSDLTGTPTLGTAAATDSTAYATSVQGTLADRAVQPDDLATVATSGDYSDLSGTPTLGTAAATDSTAYATAAQGTTADSALQPGDIGVSVQGFDANTVVDADYVSTDENFTTADHAKLDGIEAGATADQTGAEIKSLYEAEADTNAFTDADASKLSGIEAGAEVNVNADWNSVSGDSFIQNKPTLGTAAATDLSDYATAAQGTKADSAIQPGDLSTVATTGAYGDLTDAPTLGTAASTDSTDYATAAQGTKADSAVQPGDPLPLLPPVLMVT